MRFTWYELRTTDPEAAQAFYAQVLGWSIERAPAGVFFHHGGQRLAELTVLPERARALGAPPNWLGHIAVPDLEAWTQRFLDAGAVQLGPMRLDARGSVVTLRMAQQEVLALSSRGDGPSPAVRWHELHTTDVERALSTYAQLLSLVSTGTLALQDYAGRYETFAFTGSARSHGGMLETARAPHIHTHWLYYFAVEDLAGALSAVRKLGGTVIAGPVAVPGGDLIAQCEDAQGAAFALRESKSTKD